MSEWASTADHAAATSDQQWASTADHAQPSDAGFWSTIGRDVMNMPAATMDFLTGHPVEQTLQTIRDLTAARQQHQQRAADAYNKGDYKEAFHQLMFSIPVIGPPVGAAVDEIKGGQPGQGFAHGVEAVAPLLAPELNTEGFARIGGAVREAPAAIRAIPRAAAEKILSTAGPAADVLTSPVARDVAGMVSPRASHALSLAARAKRVVQALAGGEAEAADAVEQFAKSKYQVQPVRYGPPAPAEPPPGFGVGAGSTAEAIPAATPPSGPVYQPPVSGALPGTVITAPAVEDLLRQRGFGIAGASTAEPVLPAAVPPSGPVYQPPVSGALPGTVAPAAPPAATTPQTVALAQAYEDLMRRRAEAAAIPAANGGMTPAEAAADFAQRRATMLEQPPAETAFQEQKARIEEGMTPPEETPPAAPAAPAAAVLPEGHVAVPEGSTVLAPMPEGIPAHYGDMYAREGEMNTARAFAKDKRIAEYVLSKGITPDEFAAMPLEQQNKLVVEAPAASAKGKHKAFVERPEGALRTMGRWADEGIGHITDTMRWLEGQEAPAAAGAGGATIVPDAGTTSPGPAISGTSRSVQAVNRPVEGQAGGAETVIRIPGEQTTYPARYAVRELTDVQPSHNPHTFQQNPAYEYRNDRNYSDAANQERIVVDSQPGRFAPEYLITDSPDAVNGAPVISEGGSVLGGNSRAMKLARVYANNPQDAAAYRALLERKAAQFGIDPAQVRAMRNPVLVRELTGAAEPQKLITDLNKSGTAALTAAERATADARRMSAGAADYLAKAIEAEGPDATLNDALTGKQGAKIVNQLVDDGVFTMQEKPQLIDARTGALTAAAKERISKMLLGQVFADSDQMIRTPAAIRNKLERIVSPLLQSGQKPGFDILPAVRQSLDLLEYARAHGITNMGDVLSQEGLFGGAPKFSAEAAQLAEFLRDESPTRIAGAFRRYVANAEPTMFGESTPTEAFADAFGAAMPAETSKTPTEAKATFAEQKAKASRRSKKP